MKTEIESNFVDRELKRNYFEADAADFIDPVSTFDEAQSGISFVSFSGRIIQSPISH